MGISKKVNSSEKQKCRSCGIEYSATAEFFKVDNGNASGIASICKKCDSEYQKQYYKKHKDKLLK